MYKKSNHINRKQGSRSSNGASFRLRRHIIHIRGRRGNHRGCVSKPLFGRNRFAYTTQDLQICSED